MADTGKIQLDVHGLNALHKDEIANNEAPSLKTTKWQWWLMIFLNVIFVQAGQTVATLLGRLYYNEGGNSKWMATLVQSVGFPVLFIPLLFHPSATLSSSKYSPSNVSATKIKIIYVCLGLIITGDNLMYSYGLQYLPLSTYSLICSTQLAFNAIFAYFLNSQKFTSLIFNSVILLTFSAALLGVQSESDTTDSSKNKYPLGFLLTLGASATYSLILSLTQLTFQKIIKRETFAVVLHFQIWTSFVAASATVVGLFASGEWRALHGEFVKYEKGKVSYAMTLIWIAVSWQVFSVGTVGLVFAASSLFSSVISTLSLPVVPVFAVVFFHDKMDGVKVVAMLIASWGFLSYMYQHYLDYNKAKRAVRSSTDADMVEIFSL